MLTRLHKSLTVSDQKTCALILHRLIISDMIGHHSLLSLSQIDRTLAHGESGFCPVTSATRHRLGGIARLCTITTIGPKAVQYILLTTHFPIPACYLSCYSSA